MCIAPKAPKVVTPPPPPPAPPPPVETAKKVENTSLKKRQSASKKRGTPALTIRRSTVNTGMGGTGTNISY